MAVCVVCWAVMLKCLWIYTEDLVADSAGPEALLDANSVVAYAAAVVCCRPARGKLESI